MIDQEEINTIKQNVDLVSLVKSRGVKLRKNGKGYKGCCPFHEETKPSFSVNSEQNLWNCFGCNKGGDVIRFVELIDGIDFKEAVKRLSDQIPAFGKRKTKVAVEDLDPAKRGKGNKSAYPTRNCWPEEWATTSTGDGDGSGDGRRRGRAATGAATGGAATGSNHGNTML